MRKNEHSREPLPGPTRLSRLLAERGISELLFSRRTRISLWRTRIIMNGGLVKPHEAAKICSYLRLEQPELFHCSGEDYIYAE